MDRIRRRNLLRRILSGMGLVIAVSLMNVPMAALAGKIVNSSFLGNIAIKGYDPVAYFKAGKPVEGAAENEHKWMGATWRFSSAVNRDAFAADPQRYAPQFGGYCAWAVSQGYTADIDPDAWKIVSGKLYLNYSKSVQAEWQQDIPGNIAKGNANWPKIRAELSQ